MVRDGLLNRLDLAFSRDQADRVYVQHKMLDYGADLWRWLDEGAHFYVCGDATRMAHDVDAALTTIIKTHGGMSDEAAHRLQARTGRGEALRARRVLTRSSGLAELYLLHRQSVVRSPCSLRFVDSKETSMRRRLFLAGGAGAVVAVSAQSVVACSSPATESSSRVPNGGSSDPAAQLREKYSDEFDADYVDNAIGRSCRTVCSKDNGPSCR